MEEISIVVSASAGQALAQLDALAQKLQAVGKAAEQIKEVKLEVSAKSADVQLDAVLQKLRLLRQTGDQGTEIAVGVSAKDAMPQLDTIIARLEGIQSAKNNEIKVSVSTEAAETQLTELGTQMEALAEKGNAIKDPLQGAISDMAGKAVETTMKNVADGMKDQTKKFVNDLGEAFKGDGAIPMVFSELAKSGKAILTKGLAGAGIDLLLGGVTSLITYAVSYREEVERAAAVEREANRETLAASQARVSRLDELIKRYRKLAEAESLSADEYREVGQIQRELTESYGVAAIGMDGLTKSSQEYAKALQEVSEGELATLGQNQKRVAMDAYLAANNDTFIKQLEDRANREEELAYLTSERGKAGFFQLRQDMRMEDPVILRAYTAEIDVLKSKIANLNDDLRENEPLLADWLTAAVEEAKINAQQQGEEWSDTISDVLLAAFEYDPEKLGGLMDQANAYVDQYRDAIIEAAKNTDVTGALGEVGNLARQVLFGDLPPEEAVAEAMPYLDTLTDYFKDFAEAAGMSAEETAPFVDEIMRVLTNINHATDEGDVAAYFQSLANGGTDAAGAVGGASGSVDKLKASFDALQSRANNLTAMKNLVKDSRDLVTEFKKAEKEGKSTADILTKLNANGKKVGVTFDATRDNLSDWEKALDSAEGSIDSMIATTIGDLGSLIQSAQAAEQSILIDGQITANEAPALAAIQGVIASAISAKEALAAIGALVGSSSGGGGGGGGGKNAAEQAAREAERARKEAIQEDYRLIEHKRRLNEITFEEELAMLEKLRQKHKLNAEEIMDWEEKVYALKQEIRQRDAGSIDKTADGLIDALEGRYQAMLDAETERLDASRKAWQDWRDDSVKAIQDQIDALDELAKTEDREKQDQEELRKIAKLRQDIEFEQDDYNRMKLQQQLDQAISAREDRLRRQAIDDQKDALRKDIEAISERAEAELKALDEEQTEIEKAYAEQMKTAALRAEAEKMLMSSTQDELIQLIGEYAPDYDALGKTLGEKLLDGFKSKVGDVVTWFASLNGSLYAIQEAAAAEAIAASNSLYSSYASNQSAGATELPASTVVNQTVNFNEPVDSAGETARRLRQVNEELGSLLY